MCNDIFSANLVSLRSVNPVLAGMVEQTVADSTYRGTFTARSGQVLPCYGDGTPANSRYDPCAEAERTIAELGENTFVLFLGITGGFHIRAFLRKYPEAHCAAAEATLPALRSLLETIPLGDILSRNNIHIVSDCQTQTLETQIPGIYLPALHGSFATNSLRSWSSRFLSPDVQTAVSSALAVIGRDYSVQAHFGRIWFSNIIKNLSAMNGRFCTTLPVPDMNTTPVIAAAGPSLEKSLPEIAANRNRFTIFSTDTAYGTLTGYGIVPEYFVTIDPQYYSSQHLVQLPDTDTIILADLIANPLVIRRALSSGSRVLLAAGGHPLARLAAGMSPLPVLNTSSGTVTGAARNAAIALGYDSPRIIGGDFAYTLGKPYARGTYLSSLFDSLSNRTSSTESAFVALMFRTDVERIQEPDGWTYRTQVLCSYRDALENEEQKTRWSDRSFSVFPADVFLTQLAKDLQDLLSADTADVDRFGGMLPFFAWFQHQHDLPAGEKSRKKAIQLALDMIAGYTGTS